MYKIFYRLYLAIGPKALYTTSRHIIFAKTKRLYSSLQHTCTRFILHFDVPTEKHQIYLWYRWFSMVRISPNRYVHKIFSLGMSLQKQTDVYMEYAYHSSANVYDLWSPRNCTKTVLLIRQKRWNIHSLNCCSDTSYCSGTSRVDWCNERTIIVSSPDVLQTQIAQLLVLADERHNVHVPVLAVFLAQSTILLRGDDSQEMVFHSTHQIFAVRTHNLGRQCRIHDTGCNV